MTLQQLLRQLDNTKPWFYPEGLSIWVKDNPEPPFISLHCQAGLMWHDMDDTDGWTKICDLSKPPSYSHFGILFLFIAGADNWDKN